MACVVLALDATTMPPQLHFDSAFLDWVRALGVDPGGCRSLTVLADGDGTVEFDLYERDHRGRLVGAGGEIATHRTTRPLTVAIPASVTEAVRG